MNGKRAIPLWRLSLPYQPINLGKRRRSCGQFGQETVQGTGISLDLDPNPVGLVPDKTVESQTRSQPVNERPEPHALNDSLNIYRATLHKVNLSSEEFCRT